LLSDQVELLKNVVQCADLPTRKLEPLPVLPSRPSRLRCGGRRRAIVSELHGFLFAHLVPASGAAVTNLRAEPTMR
jgi:hypothetical protein